MNPPFNDPSQQPSPDPDRRRAHAAHADLLPRWLRSARAALRDGGTVTLIWRAEGLAQVISALADGFGAVAIMPVYPAPHRAAIRLIATAEKGGAAPLHLLPPLMLNDSSLRPTGEAEAVLRHGAALPAADLAGI